MPRIEIDRADWIAGFKDGESGRPNAPGPGIDGYSYASGYVEGAAKRQGYEYSLGTVTEEDLRDGP